MTLIKVKSRGTDNVSGRRNLIINGAMQVAQRATTTTGQGYQTVDRFKTNFSGPALTTTQHTLSTTDTPYSLGFRKSYQVHVTDPQTPNAAVDYAEIEYRVEAQDIATSGWNFTSASSKITLSFWVLSTVAGTYSVYMRDLDGNHGYSFDYTVTANTWKKVTHTVPGNANLVFNNDNGPGLVMYFTLYYGTNYTATKTDEAWAVHSSTNQVGDYAQNILATDESKFEITGVQLEVGDSASDFEYRSFGEELTLCQRYFQEFGRGGGDEGILLGMIRNSHFTAGHRFIISMRASPTITTYGGNSTTGAVQVVFGGAVDATHNANSGDVVEEFINNDGFRFRVLSTSGGGGGDGAYIDMGTNTNQLSFDFNSEL
tara:strand:+ start:791 stop:1906 length:1116 start_codon:yes stop_codon:yes gene_type:complete